MKHFDAILFRSAIFAVLFCSTLLGIFLYFVTKGCDNSRLYVEKSGLTIFDRKIIESEGYCLTVKNLGSKLVFVSVDHLDTTYINRLAPGDSLVIKTYSRLTEMLHDEYYPFALWQSIDTNRGRVGFGNIDYVGDFESDGFNRFDSADVKSIRFPLVTQNENFKVR